MADNDKKESKINVLVQKVRTIVNYCWTGVWKETRDNGKIRAIKVMNLSVRSFFDSDLQYKSMALTYSTVLAIVPALALIFAIGRGFGFQNMLEDELFKAFPAQRQGIEFALKFVDSYLKEASQGLFVGIGIIFLLWTLISLLSNIEGVFNLIWDVKRDRSMYQKVTDYISICLMVPILMICSSGISIFSSTVVQDDEHFAFLTPLVNLALEASPVVLAFLAFSLSFYLIPNTKVQFKYAAISGGICAIFFQILQLLFVNGQIYVSKYNAIYGSFAFLPLLLIWLQLSWLILLFGCVLACSLQNVLSYNFMGVLEKMSENYRRKVTVVLSAAVVRRFRDGKTPLTRAQLSFYYDVPIRVVTTICDQLHLAGLINFIVLGEGKVGVAPATETGTLTVGELLRRIDSVGDHDFIPRFSLVYRSVLDEIDALLLKSYQSMEGVLVCDIDLPIDKDKEAIVDSKPQPFITPDSQSSPVDPDA